MSALRYSALVAVNGVVILLLLGLGVWQLERLRWKEGLIHDLERAVAAETPSVTLKEAETVLTKDLSRDFVRVRARGEFLNHDERYLFAARSGEPGWHVLVPMRAVGDGDLLVFVDRGFVPETLKDPSTRPEMNADAVVDIEGFARRKRPQGAFTPDNNVARNTWYWPDVHALFASLPEAERARPYPYIVEALPQSGASRWPQAVPPDPRALPNNHLQYAVTWFGLAVVWALMTAIFLISRRRAREP